MGNWVIVSRDSRMRVSSCAWTLSFPKCFVYQKNKKMLTRENEMIVIWEMKERERERVCLFHFEETESILITSNRTKTSKKVLTFCMLMTTVRVTNSWFNNKPHNSQTVVLPVPVSPTNNTGSYLFVCLCIYDMFIINKKNSN
jgi:hypothetical protein